MCYQVQRLDPLCAHATSFQEWFEGSCIDAFDHLVKIRNIVLCQGGEQVANVV